MTPGPEVAWREGEDAIAHALAQASAKAKDPSPAWYVALMAGLMVIGVVLVLLRFVFEWDQTVLIIGLLAIAAGFLMTTNYR